MILWFLVWTEMVHLKLNEKIRQAIAFWGPFSQNRGKLGQLRQRSSSDPVAISKIRLKWLQDMGHPHRDKHQRLGSENMNNLCGCSMVARWPFLEGVWVSHPINRDV